MNEQMHEWMGCMSGTILSFQNSGFLSLMQISFRIIICIIHWPRATSLVFDNDDEDLPTLSNKHNNNNNWMLYFEKALTSIIAFYSVSTLIKGRVIIFILQMEKKIEAEKGNSIFPILQANGLSGISRRNFISVILSLPQKSGILI